jgi:hypothetical protein
MKIDINRVRETDRVAQIQALEGESELTMNVPPEIKRFRVAKILIRKTKGYQTKLLQENEARRQLQSPAGITLLKL